MNAAHASVITRRDIKILQLVYSYDTCSADHICTRFFASGAQRACYSRIAKLIQSGYLRGHRLSALSGVGSGKRLLGLTAKGRATLAKELELLPSELRRLSEVETPHAGAHHLAVCDVRLSLELACEQKPAISCEWVSERELRNLPVRKVADPRPQPDGKPAAEISLIPDGQLTITLPSGAEQSFLLELDLGTTSAKRMLSKLAGYLALSQAFPILWVVPDSKRLTAIASWALKLSKELRADPSIFWITTKAQISPQTVLTPIWKVIGGPEAHSLIPASQMIAGGPLPSIEVGQTKRSPPPEQLSQLGHGNRGALDYPGGQWRS